MTDLILIPVGLELIALDREQFEAARERARELFPASTVSAPAPEQLLTAEGIAALLQVPPSQIEALGRQGRIPSLQIGKYRRFSYSQAVAAFQEDARCKT